MKKLKLLFCILFAAPGFVFAQDYGVAGSYVGFSPLGDTSHAGMLPGFRAELTLWNTDFGFPALGTESISYTRGFQKELRQLNTADINNNAVKASVKFSYWMFGMRYTTEVVQPTKHLAVHLGIGFYYMQTFQTLSAPGHTFLADGVIKKAGAVTIEGTLGVSYELPFLNLFANAGYFRGIEETAMPGSGAISVNAGVFVPFFRR